MMSASRWIPIGGALLGVGGALAIARLAYVWQNGGHFWDVLSTLGVVVAGLGFVIMIVGWVMPKEEPSSPSQVQIGGDRSTNIQAGRDINFPRNGQSGELAMRSRQEQSGGADSVNIQTGKNATVHMGITVSEARDIALDVFNSNFLSLRGIAEEVARDRAERITREFLETLQARNPAGLSSMGDPDMLRTLYAAQEGYACSGEDDLEGALIDLLIDRAGQGERDLKTYVLNQAIITVPKLTKQQRAALAVVFFVKHTRYAGPFDLSSFYRYIVGHLVPFVAEMPENLADFRYMQYTGVGSLGIGSTMLGQAFYNEAYGFFVKGFLRKEAAAPWTSFLDDNEVFMPCLRDSQKLQIKARSLSDVQELAEAKKIPTLLTHIDLGRMYEHEINEDLITHVPSLEKLVHKWDSVGFSNFDLTAVGVAIGHACMRKVVGDVTPLEQFLL
jgi:hypothetical protein